MFVEAVDHSAMLNQACVEESGRNGREARRKSGLGRCWAWLRVRWQMGSGRLIDAIGDDPPMATGLPGTFRLGSSNDGKGARVSTIPTLVALADG